MTERRPAMSKKIMLAISNAEGDCGKVISCKELEKNDYETKYKGKLTCIKGCKARIKFTERKNNIKFLVHGIKKEICTIKVVHMC